jgi:hypothetical protein
MIKKEVRSMIFYVLGQGTPVIASRFKAGLTVSIRKNIHLSKVVCLRAHILSAPLSILFRPSKR